MLNQLIVAGVVKSLKEGELIIYIPDNELTISINISNSFYERSKNHIKEDMIVAIKGRLKLNEENNLEIVAEKMYGLDKSLEKKPRNQSYER